MRLVLQSTLLPILAMALLLCACKQATQKTDQSTAKTSASTSWEPWWKEAVVYQIYPRSFKDSNGDGVGDLQGIISKLDYVKSLGIDMVWLNPIYASPNKDNGYDISDYQNIMKEFGTMQDFDALLKGFHDREIKVFMDLVVNHCSSEHAWFKSARSSRNSPYYKYFHWWPAEKGKPPYRWSIFDEKGDAWEYNKATNSYYLHYFADAQPDMQWDNSDNGGFGAGKPWLKVNPNYANVNVAAQEKDPNSVLNYFRKMVQLRKKERTLIYGDFKLVDAENPSIFAYTRSLEGRTILVLLNFKAVEAKVNTEGLDLSKAKVLLGNYPDAKATNQLKAYEALVLSL